MPAPTTAPAPAPAPGVVVTERPPPVLVPVGLNSLPYFSKVLVDGEEVGRTPWTGQLPAGSHTVVLEGSKGGRAEFPLRLTAGQKQVVCWDYDRSGPCPH